jgi:membrane protein YqaA with SNARE-associated domain
MRQLANSGRVIEASLHFIRRGSRARIGGHFGMLAHYIFALSAPAVARGLRRWLFHLGGLGFIPLGLLDSSVIPLPGSMDVLTIVLAAGKKELWWYYALMATAGSVIGGFVTYRIARKGGKETLERKVRAKKLKKVYKTFERWGFGTIAVGALLPPPVPFVPVLLVAGAMQYSVKKFLAALALGRAARYSILAFLAARYGRQALKLISNNGHTVLIAVIAIGVAGIGAGIYYFVKREPGKKGKR